MKIKNRTIRNTVLGGLTALLLGSGVANGQSGKFVSLESPPEIADSIKESISLQDPIPRGMSRALYTQWKSGVETIIEKKAMMEVYRTSDDESYNKYYNQQLPAYAEEFKQFMSFMDHNKLWPHEKNPWYFKFENAKLEYVRDMTPMKSSAIAYHERVIAEADKVFAKMHAKEELTRQEKAVSTHKFDYAGAAYRLSSMYSIIGAFDKFTSNKALSVAIKGLKRIQSGKKTLLEQALRIKIANILHVGGRFDEGIKYLQYVHTIDTDNYSENRQDFELNMTRAYETLGNLHDSKGENDDALLAYNNALNFTNPQRASWSSLKTNLARVYSKEGNRVELDSIVDEIEQNSPKNLISTYLIVGNEFYSNKNFESASEFFLKAFSSAKFDARDKTEAITNLIRSYGEMGRPDFILELMRTAKKDPIVFNNDEVMHTYCKTLVDVGTEMRAQYLSEKEWKPYFEEAEGILKKRSFGKTLVKDSYATKSVLILGDLYIGKRDWKKAIKAFESVLASNQAHIKEPKIRQQYPGARYTSNLVALAEIGLGSVAHRKGDKHFDEAAKHYKHVIQNYSSEPDKTLSTHQNHQALEAGIESMLRIGRRHRQIGLYHREKEKGDKAQKSLNSAFEVYNWIFEQGNLSVDLRSTAEFEMANVNYFRGARQNFIDALAIFDRLRKDDSSIQQDKASIMAGMCYYKLGFLDEAMDIWEDMFSSHVFQKDLFEFLTAENHIHNITEFSEKLYNKGTKNRAIGLLEGLRDVINQGSIVSADRPGLLYTLANCYMTLKPDEMPKQERWDKAGIVIDEYFADRYSTLNPWIYIKTEGLQIDLLFEKGELTRADLDRAITHLENPEMGKGEVKDFFKKTSLFKSQGMSFKDQTRHRLASLYNKRGYLNFLDNRFFAAIDDYNTVFKRYKDIKEYASSALYDIGITYVEMDEVDKAINNGFKKLLEFYPETDIAEAGFDKIYSMALYSTSEKLKRWRKVTEDLYEYTLEARPAWASAFGQLMFDLSERNILTENRAILKEVRYGFKWITEQDAVKDSAVVVAKNLQDQSRVLLGDAYLHDDDLRDGSAYRIEGIRLFPKTGGNTKKAIKAYSQIVDDPESSYFGASLSKLVRAHFLKGDFKKARKRSYIDMMDESKRVNTTLEQYVARRLYTIMTYHAMGDKETVAGELRNLLEETKGLDLDAYMTRKIGEIRNEVKALNRLEKMNLKTDPLYFEKHKKGA